MKKDNTAPFIIEGISYLTVNPVRIEIIDGRIGDIIEIAGLEDKNSILHVSQVLIDNQINGYENVDFSGSNPSSAGGIIMANIATELEGVME